MVGQLIRFAAIGLASTAAYLLLFVLLRTGLGAQPANLLALLVTAVANTAANRRITFGIRGGPGAGRAQLQGLVVFGLGLALTSGSLAVLHAVTTDPGRGAEALLLVAANALATLARFVLFRGWVFHRRSGHALPGPAGTHDHLDGTPSQDHRRRVGSL
jgi:putative flippase GtrA